MAVHKYERSDGSTVYFASYRGPDGKRITDEQIPFTPLHDQGYPSVGCWPCTRPVTPGEDERAGRWSGTAKTECGLHTSAD